jgi:hypothetical protein
VKKVEEATKNRVKIDIFLHIYPKRFVERILSELGSVIEMVVRFW